MDGRLQNDLVRGDSGMISASCAAGACSGRGGAASSRIDRVLCDGSRSDIHRAAERVPEFQKQYREYLEKFGDRCLEELKLESATLHDDPLTLLRAVGNRRGGWPRRMPRRR